MRGNNSIHMNQATLIAAVQAYLRSERLSCAAPVTVTSVLVDSNSGGCLHVLVNIASPVPEDTK